MREVAYINPEVHRQFCEMVNPTMYEITPKMASAPPFVNVFDGEIKLCPRCLGNYLKPDPDQNVRIPLMDVEGDDLSFQVCADCGGELEALANNQITITSNIMDRQDNLDWHIAHILDNV